MMVLLVARRDRGHHDCATVAAQPVLEQPRQLGVAERNEDKLFFLQVDEAVV